MHACLSLIYRENILLEGRILQTLAQNVFFYLWILTKPKSLHGPPQKGWGSRFTTMKSSNLPFYSFVSFSFKSTLLLPTLLSSLCSLSRQLPLKKKLRPMCLFPPFDNQATKLKTKPQTASFSSYFYPLSAFRSPSIPTFVLSLVWPFIGRERCLHGFFSMYGPWSKLMAWAAGSVWW